ncbi:MAG: WbuC family cupin fold metalloprotein [Myxococcales bacterium]|nr:WbuC family cupin fold metalloprotein [Myxococcales bacterium]
MNGEVELIGAALLNGITREASRGARRRKNHNFHEPGAEGADRLLNAVEPGSYIQPHRHLAARKDETLVVLRGAFGLVFFDAAGTVTRSALARAGGEVLGANIPRGTYHTLVALEPGSVFFEAKAGPYAALEASERAPWAPAEGDPGAQGYLRELEALFA